MNAARVAVLAVLLVLVPAVSVAYDYTPRDYRRVREALVAEHAVFTVLQTSFCGSAGGDVTPCHHVVPGEAPGKPRKTGRFGGESLVPTHEVRWFNDQRLADATGAFPAGGAAVAVLAREQVFASSSDWQTRYPCGGWVLATPAGAPDPRTSWSATYATSYRVEDPQGYAWTIDRFAWAPEVDAPLVPVWAVPILGLGVQDPGPASGISCLPYEDHAVHDDTGYHDAGDDAPTRAYNALFVLPLDALAPSGAVLHGDGMPDGAAATGCAQGSEWACPAGPSPEALEGNSHPHNPWFTDSGPAHAHATADVDLYYAPFMPWSVGSRSYALYDVDASDAPFDDRSGRDVP